MTIKYNSQAVHQNAVVVLTTGQTATTGMLAVLADATMAHERVTTLVASLLQVRRHVPAEERWNKTTTTKS